MIVFVKDKDATLDYTWDWSDWLGQDTISVASVTVDDNTLQINSVAQNATAVTVWVSGGQPGKRYGLTCRVTTTGGRADERTIFLDVIER